MLLDNNLLTKLCSNIGSLESIHGNKINFTDILTEYDL